MSAVKLTLVFCCYNVSEYLDEVYNWLVTQPYKNIEVLFIEDCSTDDTKNKLKSLVNDPRMKIIENEVNLGLSESRNVGLRNATGDYIGFPDPDDIFDIDWLDKIAEVININQPTVIISGMREDYENCGELKYNKGIKSRYSGKITDLFIEALLDLEDTMLFGYMNNKFYRRNLLLDNDIFCTTMALKEDFDLNIRVFDKIDSFYILNEPLYFYKKRINGNTLTSKYVTDYFEIHENSVFMLKRLIESRTQLSDVAITLLVNRFFRYLLSAVERNNNKKSGMAISAQIEWIRKIMEEDKYIWFFEHIEYMSGKMKIIKILLKNKKPMLLVFIGFFLKTIKSKLPIIFAKAKSS